TRTIPRRAASDEMSCWRCRTTAPARMSTRGALHTTFKSANRESVKATGPVAYSAEGGSRTHTPLRALDFESSASAISPLRPDWLREVSGERRMSSRAADSRLRLSGLLRRATCGTTGLRARSGGQTPPRSAAAGAWRLFYEFPASFICGQSGVALITVV